jgi:hypothetical protein
MCRVRAPRPEATKTRIDPRNQREAAREPLAAGLRLALRCAASELAARAEDELRLSGARSQRIVTTGIAALTPAEWRVADQGFPTNSLVRVD